MAGTLALIALLAAAPRAVALSSAPTSAPSVLVLTQEGADVATADEAPRLSPEAEARAQALEGRLKCPVCKVQSVRESTSFMALEMRAKIRELIGAGATDDQVLQFFVDRYGDYILLEPRRRGIGLAAYLLPVAVLALGVLVILHRTRGRPAGARHASASPDGAAGAPMTSELSVAEETRVDEELKRYTA